MPCQMKKIGLYHIHTVRIICMLSEYLYGLEHVQRRSKSYDKDRLITCGYMTDSKTSLVMA